MDISTLKQHLDSAIVTLPQLFCDEIEYPEIIERIETIVLSLKIAKENQEQGVDTFASQRSHFIEYTYRRAIIYTLIVPVIVKRGSVQERREPELKFVRAYQCLSSSSLEKTHNSNCSTIEDLQFLFATLYKQVPYLFIPSIHSQESYALHELLLHILCEGFALPLETVTREILIIGNNSYFSLSFTLDTGEKWVISLNQGAPITYDSWKKTHSKSDTQHTELHPEAYSDQSFNVPLTSSQTISLHTLPDVLPKVNFFDSRLTITDSSEDKFSQIQPALDTFKKYYPGEADLTQRLQSAFTCCFHFSP